LFGKWLIFVVETEGKPGGGNGSSHQPLMCITLPVPVPGLFDYLLPTPNASA